MKNKVLFLGLLTILGTTSFSFLETKTSMKEATRAVSSEGQVGVISTGHQVMTRIEAEVCDDLSGRYLVAGYGRDDFESLVSTFSGGYASRKQVFTTQLYDSRNIDEMEKIDQHYRDADFYDQDREEIDRVKHSYDFLNLLSFVNQSSDLEVKIVYTIKRLNWRETAPGSTRNVSNSLLRQLEGFRLCYSPYSSVDINYQRQLKIVIGDQEHDLGTISTLEDIEEKILAKLESLNDHRKVPSNY